jgi:cyclopropane fatty-acyl-phospholipid synthase-like methyltransferase
MTAYDEVPYACQPIPCTAPEQLALASQLHGGPCPRIEGARALEIGCGNAANLIPLAFFRPDCEFVGVDSSVRQIADASLAAERLGLSNLTLHAADICEIGKRLGGFDYVIAHGVMSWVSDEVRDAIFGLCRDRLAPDGLVYLSYNTFPGWLIRGVVRASLLRPREPGESLPELAEAGRQRAQALRSVIEEAEHPYAQLFARELAHVDSAGESSLVHDYLSPHNRAYWFRDFAALAARFGFHYLTEAPFNQPDYRVPAPIREAAQKLESDPREIEQLIDVLWYRQHRASLFCHQGSQGSAVPDESVLERVTLAAACRPDADDVELARGVEQRFVGLLEANVTITSDDPLEKAALTALAAAWPQGLGWRELFAQATQLLRERGLEAPGARNEASLRAGLLALHGMGQVELRLRPLPPSRAPAERPALSPLTRLEIERRALFTTPTHQRMSLTVTDRLILERLTGERTPAEIEASVVEALRAGGASDPRALLPTSELPESMTLEQWVAARVAQDLTLLAAWGLLQ